MFEKNIFEIFQKIVTFSFKSFGKSKFPKFDLPKDLNEKVTILVLKNNNFFSNKIFSRKKIKFSMRFFFKFISCVRRIVLKQFQNDLGAFGNVCERLGWSTTLYSHYIDVSFTTLSSQITTFI